jgi:hypothetical protein
LRIIPIDHLKDAIVSIRIDPVDNFEIINIDNPIDGTKYTYKIGEIYRGKLYVYWNETQFNRRIRIILESIS